MAEVTLAASASGNSGVLSADTKFRVKEGSVTFSTDGGTSKDEFSAGERIIFSSGLTVTWENIRPIAAQFSYDPI